MAPGVDLQSWLADVLMVVPDAQHLGMAIAFTLLSYTVFGLVGFGSALVFIPLASWYWPLSLIVPWVLVVDIPASMLHTGLNLKQVAWAEIPRLILPALFGAGLGAVLSQHVDARWLMLVLGLYVAGVGLMNLRRLRVSASSSVADGDEPACADGVAAAPVLPAQQVQWPRLWLAGGMMGLVESLFGTAGPVILAWLSQRLPTVQQLRATLPMALVVIALIALASAGWAGQLSQPLLWWAVVVLTPVSLAGVLLGHLLARWLQGAWLARAVHAMLVISGLLLIGRSVAVHGVAHVAG